MRVILRPMNRHTWSNVVKFRNCYDFLTPYWTRSGNIYTGLISEDAQRLGTMLGLNLLPTSSYWNNFFVRIGSDDVYLDTEDPLDEIKYLFLRNHKRVKTSVFENKAGADYLLINKEEEAKRENLLNKSKVDALFEFKRMSVTDMRKCLRLFGHNAENVTGELVENTLFKIIEANPEKFLDKWVNNRERETEVLIEKAIGKNVIRRNKNIYKFGGEVIGYSMIEVIDFLKNPKNQDIKLSIINAVDAKDFIVEGDAPAKDLEAFVQDTAKSETKVVKKPKIVSSKLGEDDVDAVDIDNLDFTNQ